MSVADKLLQVNQVKQDIKTAIETKGVPMTNVAFTEYANKILDISGGGGGDFPTISYDEIEHFGWSYYIFSQSNVIEQIPQAWESSLAVDPLEISENSTAASPSGKAQYPNGETEGVIIPQGVTSIGRYAFYRWNSNNQPLVIPNSVTSIGNTAFGYWTSNNQPLVIPDSVTSIDINAFFRWEANNQPLVIPNSITSIGNSAFSNWFANDQPLVIPDSVTSIGNYAFYNWTSNNQPLVIPNSVTSIGNSAFYSWNSNNQPLVISNSVTSIGTQAFYNWSSVPYVEIQAITPPTLANASAFNNQNNAPIYVPDESVAAYKAATNWVNLANRIFSINDK